MPAYTITADYGKPYDIPCRDEQQLREELVKLKEIAQREDHAFLDVYIRDEQDNDISESQWIQELVAEILEVRA